MERLTCGGVLVLFLVITSVKRDRERERERARGGEGGREREWAGGREREREGEWERGRVRERARERERELERELERERETLSLSPVVNIQSPMLQTILLITFLTSPAHWIFPPSSPARLTAFPLTTIQSLPNVALLSPAHGGHIAFLQGLFPRGASFMESLFGQFVQAAFEHPQDIREACGIKEEQRSWSSSSPSPRRGWSPWHHSSRKAIHEKMHRSACQRHTADMSGLLDVHRERPTDTGNHVTSLQLCYLPLF